MNTPIIEFVKKYNKIGFSRLHMPAHKGKKMLGAEHLDITEIDGADVLYSGNGIISESEKNVAELFGAAATYYSTEGSTLSIKAMLAVIAQGVTGRNPFILAARNVHKSFVYGCALLDIRVEWLYGEAGSLCECRITPQILENALKSLEQKPDAVYVTSPDYLGNILDISGLSGVCERYGVPLLVDNAHGAYLRFLSPSQHPIDLGAAMCADSAHKTLPVLTGGGYLHISKRYKKFTQIAPSQMQLFASTSPSYLILQSLDLCNKYLAEGYNRRLAACIERVEGIKNRLTENGMTVIGGEPLKITVDAAKGGYTGKEIADILRQNKIEPEFYDGTHIVLMLSPENTARDFTRLKKAFGTVKARGAVCDEAFGIPKGERAVSIRSAVLAASEVVPVDNSIGRVCAAPAVSCPPAIPIVISGERITAEAVKIMQSYKIKNVEVIKNAN